MEELRYCQCGCGEVVRNNWVMGHQFRGVSPHNKGNKKIVELHLCACGQCNEMVPGRFKRGHGARVNHWSKGPEAERIKSSLSTFASQRTGERSPRFGKTKETNPAFSNAGRKKGCVAWNKDLHDYFNEEALAGISAGRKGLPAWNSGLKGCHPPEVLAVISENSKKLVHTEEFKDNLSKRMLTPDNPWYVDGRSSGENRAYPLGWKEQLREAIRERDGHKCVVCSLPEEQNKKKLPVHHVDYDRENLNPDNLVSLCSHCHGKTNTRKNHSKWISFFKSSQRLKLVNLEVT